MLPKFIQEAILKDEGGYVFDRADPGGETKYGISKRAYPKEDIKNLTPARALEIYTRDYWERAGTDSLPCSLAYCVFDFGVNAGVSRSVKTLQRVLQTQQNGILDQGVLNKILKMDQAKLCREFTLARMRFYEGLQKPKYLKGWQARANRVLALALQKGGLNAG